jgi:hypothetical protein
LIACPGSVPDARVGLQETHVVVLAFESRFPLQNRPKSEPLHTPHTPKHGEGDSAHMFDYFFLFLRMTSVPNPANM